MKNTLNQTFEVITEHNTQKLTISAPIEYNHQIRDQNFKIETKKGPKVWQMVPIGNVPINRDYCGRTVTV